MIRMNPMYSPAGASGSATRAERRAHARLAARGEVIFRFVDASAIDDSFMRGELLDISAGGYRVRHCHAELDIGQELLASYGWGEMIVRVVWHRDMSDGIDSGFTITMPVPDATATVLAETKSARRRNVADYLKRRYR